MSKKQNTMLEAAVKKNLTLSELIKNADRIKERKKETKKLYIKSQDATVTIMKPDRSVILDSYAMEEGEGNLYIAYECIVEPNFKDSQLQEAYGVTGYSILNEIFDSGDIDSLAKEILSFAGYGADSVSVVEDIKN